MGAVRLVGARTLQREIRKGASQEQMRKEPELRQVILILPWLIIPFFFRNLVIVESAVTNSKVNVCLLHCSPKGGRCLRTHLRRLPSCPSTSQAIFMGLHVQCWVVTSLQLPERAQTEWKVIFSYVIGKLPASLLLLCRGGRGHHSRKSSRKNLTEAAGWERMDLERAT